MVQTLMKNDGGLTLSIPADLLARLGIDELTPLEMTTEGNRLIIVPVAGGHSARVAEAGRRVMDVHAANLEKLAL